MGLTWRRWAFPASTSTWRTTTAAPAVAPRDDLDPSPALSLIAKAPATLKGRCVAALVTEGSDATAVDRLQTDGAAIVKQIDFVR